ncbi:MAG: hypothetical protein ACXW3O_15800 [Brevundimonas sp.]
MLVLPSLLAAITLANAPPEGPSSDVAENFVRTCVATGGDRSAVADLAGTHGWLPLVTGPRDGVVWADAYRTGESVVALYLTPATDAPTAAPSSIPVILSPPKSHCLVALRTPVVEWRQAAAVLDASDQLTPFPEAMQPADGAGGDGVVRYYSLVDQRAAVTIREDRALGVLEIKIVRGLPRDTDQ